MTIQWCDNFGAYGTGSASSAALQNMLDGTPYASVASGGVTGTALEVNPDGIGGDIVLRVGVTRIACPVPNAAMGVAGRFWLPSIPGSNNDRCALFDMRTAANQQRYRVIVEPNGALSVYYATTTNPGVPGDAACLATTTVPAILTNSWTHFEFFVDFATGEFALRREGSVLLSGTHDSPPGGSIGNIAFANSGVSSTGRTNFWLKDLVVWDDQGSNNNDFLGTVAVHRLPVDGDVSSGWTKSSGSSDYQLLDEVPPNDADYIEAVEDPLPAASIMTFGDLPPDIVGVRCVMTMVRAWKTDGGDAFLQVSLISEGDEDNGADRNISTTPTYWYDISELSPDTGQPWNPIELNNATVKINRTA